MKVWGSMMEPWFFKTIAMALIRSCFSIMVSGLCNFLRYQGQIKKRDKTS